MLLVSRAAAAGKRPAKRTGAHEQNGVKADVVLPDS